ncbi:MFS transporter [Streptomyces sp. MUSC 14]|uniref:MFS transporter n=1 Tax=Streptomyces sp. MUSC 14 TaxID=1354889 RepID=UPI0015A6B644|nr:MFS transporter [Streptomyces sp. MUSC 14]
MHRHVSDSLLSGQVPDSARDLGVSVPAAGTLTSASAVGMTVGAPLTALLGRHRPTRQTLLVFLGVSLLARVVAALADVGFLAVGLTAVTGTVTPDTKGRATAILLGGTALACVVGVPSGAALGRLPGRCSAFPAVALLSAPALAAIARSVPGGGWSGPEPPGNGARAELGALRRPRLLPTWVPARWSTAPPSVPSPTSRR